MVARDTSKKIQSAFEVKMKAGECISSFAPYGYQKDSANNNHLIVDEQVAKIVREMFGLAAEGATPAHIARQLNTNGISTPAVYRCEKRPYLCMDNYSKRREWTSAMVCKMLKNTVYVGDMVQGKTKKVSFKSKKAISKPQEAWFVVENTHEAIVSRELFDVVKNRSVSRKSSQTKGFKNILSGTAKCMDCGKNMSSTGTKAKKNTVNLTCGGYKLYGVRECTNHFIDYDTLYDIVLNELNHQISLTLDEKDYLIHKLERNSDKEQKEEIRMKHIKAIHTRIKELDKIIAKLYEDNITGKIDNQRLDRMVASFQAEEKNIKGRLEYLLEESTEAKTRAYKEVQSVVEGINGMKMLDTAVLHKFIERIEIGQGSYDENRRKRQNIKIYYKFIEKT